jgi:hypothetical protein
MRKLNSFHYFLYGIVKHSNEVWYPTCLETNFILILNFPRISAKYAPKYQKRIIFYEFKQFWWIWSFMPMSNKNSDKNLNFKISVNRVKIRKKKIQSFLEKCHLEWMCFVILIEILGFSSRHTLDFEVYQKSNQNRKI